MKKAVIFIVALLLIVTLTGAVPSAGKNAPLLAGELLIKFRDKDQIKRAHSAMKASVLSDFQDLNIHRVKLPPGIAVANALEKYRNDPSVEFAEPNYRVIKSRASLTPNDTRYADQWALQNISTPYAWALTTGRNLIVAVLDTGVNYRHPDLAANMWTNPGEIAGDGIDNDGNGIVDDIHGANFNNRVITGDPMDDDFANSHGTHVAGIIGAVGNNGIGVSGANWIVQLMAVKFLHGSKGEGTVADAILGIIYAVDKGARVINCSFGGLFYSRALEDAIQYANSKGVLIVSAAGNDGRDIDAIDIFPATAMVANNIVVSASDQNDLLAAYSNYGKMLVDVAAPGGGLSSNSPGILSTAYRCDDRDYDNICDPPGAIRLPGYHSQSGTSMAAAHVSGLAALIWSHNKHLTHYQVKGRILNGVDQVAPTPGMPIAGGRINAYNSLTVEELPAVFMISPAWAARGGAVTITGVNFGGAPGTVTVDGRRMAITSWTDTAIRATLPQEAKSGYVQVNGLGSRLYLTVTPIITLSASSRRDYVPLEATFTATIESAAPIVRYEWNTGNGTFDVYRGITDSKKILFNTPGSYVVALRVTDTAGRTGTAAQQVEVLDRPHPAGAGGGNAGCFFATAAYGSYLNPHVIVLRKFRDDYLLTNPFGRKFVSIYYQVSPPLADYIKEHDGMRFIARIMLTPIVYSLEYPALFIIVALFAMAMAVKLRILGRTQFMTKRG